MKNIFTGFATAAVLMLAGISAQAATVNLSVQATVANGAYAGLSTIGDVSYDGAAVAAIGETVLDPLVGAVALYFDAGVEIFTEINDVDYSLRFPRLTFLDGVLTFIDYEVVGGVNGANLEPYGVLGFTFEDDLTKDGRDYFVSVRVDYAAVAAVPLPAGGALLLGGLGLFGLARKRRSV